MSNELYHYGILGMKWGVRRYQNEDGTLTEAGKRRYGDYYDVKDTSRENISKIRTAEARRNYDNAKISGDKYEQRVTKRRLNEAERNEKYIKKAEKGERRYREYGETIRDNRARIGRHLLLDTGILLAVNGAVLNGKLTGREAALAVSAARAIDLMTAGYIIKKVHDNSHIRAYERGQWSGKLTKKAVGGKEYQDVLERNNKKK